MSAQLFAAAFLGCLFALATFRLAMTLVMRFRFRGVQGSSSAESLRQFEEMISAFPDDLLCDVAKVAIGECKARGLMEQAL